MDPFVGEIRLMPYANNFVTRGWLPCNGQLLNIQQSPALFALLGAYYGGNGSTNFALPNLNGRVPMGANSSTPQGAAVGTESVTLQPSQIPAHAHGIGGPVPVFTESSSNASPANSYFASTSPEAYGKTLANGSPMATMVNGGATGPAGSGQAHENRMPSLVLGYFIATVGVYPSRQ